MNYFSNSNVDQVTADPEKLLEIMLESLQLAVVLAVSFSDFVSQLIMMFTDLTIVRLVSKPFLATCILDCWSH